MINDMKDIIPIYGQKYEFTIDPLRKNHWTRPLTFVSVVPPELSKGCYKYIAYRRSPVGGTGLEYYSFVRNISEDRSPIKYEEALSKIRIGDEVRIQRYGEDLNLCAMELGPNFYARLFNGAWGISLAIALEEYSYKEFKVISIDGIEVLPPITPTSPPHTELDHNTPT